MNFVQLILLLSFLGYYELFSFRTLLHPVHQFRTRLEDTSSSSVTPGRGSSDNLKRGPQKTFILSPTTQSGSDELLILENFNQIQLGEQKKLGIIGSQDLTDGHKQMIELLAYALVLSGNHIFTSGGDKGTGTNFAVIRGALRACNPDMLTVILPSSLFSQPPDMQALLSRVVNVIEQPNNCALDFKAAATLCNEVILSQVDKVLVFCYHDSTTIINSVQSAKQHNAEIIMFYLD
jgi:hypothetical protein